MKLCECGCDAAIGPGRRFRRGHNTKLRNANVEPPNPGGLCLCGCSERAPIARQTSVKFGHLRGHPIRYIRGHSNRVRLGPLHSQWKGGRTVNSEGYVMVRIEGRYRQEHRVVMERMLGRPLHPFENVHHKNGRRDDNRPENLELWVRPQAAGQRVEDLVSWLVDTYPERVAARLGAVTF